MVKLRFQRHGRTHAPFYRLVAVDARFKRNGKAIENLGWFNPEPGEGVNNIELKVDRIRYWLGVGAQPSETVRDLLGTRDLLTPKQKKEWEMDRVYAKRRTESAAILKQADEALAAMTKLAEDTEADVSALVAKARTAHAQAKAAAGKARVDAVSSALSAIHAATAEAQKAHDAHKPAAPAE
jgi:small subunit ribosomal protein S16